MPHLPTNDSDSQDNDEPSFPSPVPKNWAPEHATHLAHHWQHLIDSRALASFKHTITHLYRPNSPISTPYLSYEHPIPPRPPSPTSTGPANTSPFSRTPTAATGTSTPTGPASNAANPRFTCLNCRHRRPSHHLHAPFDETNAIRSLRVRGPFYRGDAMAEEFF